jgi:secretion/DNA translocation related TadE-like protein
VTAGLRAGAPSKVDHDGGVATVLSAVVCLSLAVVLWLGSQVGMAIVARNRAEGAADLGALAAASYALQGQDVACARAEWVTRSMHTVILQCGLDGWAARLEVRAEGSGLLAEFVAVGHARAGPVETTTIPATRHKSSDGRDLSNVAAGKREKTVRQVDLSDGLS